MKKNSRSGKGWLIASLLISISAVLIGKIRFRPRYMEPTRTDPNK